MMKGYKVPFFTFSEGAEFSQNHWSWKKNLECMFRDNTILETQKHLEECGGLSRERRGLKSDTVGGKINFFKRVEKKLG